jgi:TIR domain-containing protein
MLPAVPARSKKAFGRIMFQNTTRIAAIFSTVWRDKHQPRKSFGITVTAPSVFLSYAHVEADKKFACVLHERLKRDGIVCFFDEASIAPGANFVLQISKAIDDCNYLAMIMSRAYFSARFAPTEWAGILSQDPQNTRGRLVPLLLEDCELPAFISSLKYIDVTSPEKLEQNYPRIWKLVSQFLPNDLEQRSKEIDELALQGKLNQAMKRLLDFARDFARSTEVMNRLIAIRLVLIRLDSERNATERAKATAEMVFAGLNIRDEIISAWAADLGQEMTR